MPEGEIAPIIISRDVPASAGSAWARDEHAGAWEGYLDDLAGMLDEDAARPDLSPRS